MRTAGTAVLWGLIMLFGLSSTAGNQGPVWSITARSSRFQWAGVQTGAELSAICLGWNLAESQRTFDPNNFTVAFVGSSTTRWAINPQALEQALERERIPADVRLYWMPSIDMLGVHYLTQHALRHPPRLVVLGLSPAITQVIVGEGNAAAGQYQWYRDRRIHTPPLEHYGWSRLPAQAQPEDTLRRWWSVYRHREVLYAYGAIVMQAGIKSFASTERALPPPDVWMMNPGNVEAFAAARAHFHRTQNAADYLAAYQYFPQGLKSVSFWHDVFERSTWRPPSDQWAALAAWTDLTREAGSTPVVAILPYNAFFMAPGSATLLGGDDASAPYLDPERYRAWEADVTAFCREQNIPLWNDFHRYPPDAFYDLHHLLPGVRPGYAGTWAARLARLRAQLN